MQNLNGTGLTRDTPTNKYACNETENDTADDDVLDNLYSAIS